MPFRKATEMLWRRRKQAAVKEKPPGLPAGKFPAFSKIPGTLELQKICNAFGIPFEQAKLYKASSIINVGEFADARRIIVRTSGYRKEFIMKPLTKAHMANIAESIQGFISKPPGPFIVQKVGLRKAIKGHGGIILTRLGQGAGEVVYREEAYKTTMPSDTDVFDIFLANTKIKNRIILEKGKFSRKDAQFINSKISNRKAYKMIEYLLNRLKLGYIGRAEIRFVRYEGNKFYFYDMKVMG